MQTFGFFIPQWPFKVIQTALITSGDNNHINQKSAHKCLNTRVLIKITNARLLPLNNDKVKHNTSEVCPNSIHNHSQAIFQDSEHRCFGFLLSLSSYMKVQVFQTGIKLYCLAKTTYTLDLDEISSCTAKCKPTLKVWFLSSHQSITYFTWISTPKKGGNQEPKTQSFHYQIIFHHKHLRTVRVTESDRFCCMLTSQSILRVNATEMILEVNVNAVHTDNRYKSIYLKQFTSYVQW